MHVFKTNQYARDEKFSLNFRKLFDFILVLPQVTANDQICHQIYILKVHECIEHIDQEPINRVNLYSRLRTGALVVLITCVHSEQN